MSKAIQKTKLPFSLYAYCLVTNHVHLLIERQTATIGRIMHRVLATAGTTIDDIDALTHNPVDMLRTLTQLLPGRGEDGCRF